jgi:hypothetical protein
VMSATEKTDDHTTWPVMWENGTGRNIRRKAVISDGQTRRRGEEAWSVISANVIITAAVSLLFCRHYPLSLIINRMILL